MLCHQHMAATPPDQTTGHSFLPHAAPMRLLLIIAALSAACSGSETAPHTCQIAVGAAAPDFVQQLGCQGDFAALASAPLDATIPGARSVKVVLDESDGDALYFQNSA